MPANGRKGALTWILGLLTLFAVVNVLSALIQLNLYGSNAATNLTIFNITFGSLNTEIYFWTSALVMLLLFTATCFSIYRGLPLDPSLMQRITKVEETLAANSSMIENTQIGFFKKLEDSEKLNGEAFHRITLNLEETGKQVAENLTKQNTVLETMGKETEKNAENVKKQATDLARIKKSLEEMESKTNEKPKVNGQTKLEDFKNVPSSLANKLSHLKITNVSELLATDSTSIAEKTGELPENIANLQAQAQLLMVPGVDEKHSELLVKCGVTSQKELANQDPVQLYRGVIGVAKTYTEQGKLPQSKVPTLEEVSSWIKQASS